MLLSHRTRSLGDGRVEQAERGVASLRTCAIARVDSCIVCCRAPAICAVRASTHNSTALQLGNAASSRRYRNGRLGPGRSSSTCAAVGCSTRENRCRIRHPQPINSTARRQSAEQHQHQHQHAAQHSKSKHHAAQRNRTPAARHSPAVRAGRYRMSPLSRPFHWQRLLGGSCARGWVLDSAPSLRVVPQQGRRHPCRLLVPAISGCCSLPLRLRRPRGGMCARNRPGVMPTAQCRLLPR